MNAAGLALPAVLLYLLTTVGLAMRLGGCTLSVCSTRKIIFLPGISAVILHALALYPELITGQGLNLGFFNAASLVALLTVVLLLLTAIWQPVESIGIPLLPITATTLGLAALYPSQHAISATSWQLDTHILFSVLAYSLFVLAAFQAVLLAIQERHLRNRKPGGFIRALPPLQVMEKLLFQMIGVGFTLLTVALLTGFFFIEDIFAQHLVHKTILSIAGWIIFGILLWGRWRFGWRGRTAIRWTLSGFALLALAYFGSKLVLELILTGNA
ncbi:Inner membrane protein YpjD [hydrothermal vent metagenome]|uniref:Inner membrane protein YpjD n=1 Tax=hydrothermal vent metagenome TaxID=652676 RepID=A0A3B0YIK9_9ZZZZ